MGFCCGADDGAESRRSTVSASPVSLHVADDSKQLERDQEFIRLLGKLQMSPSIAPRDAYTVNLHHDNAHGQTSARTSAAGAFVRSSYQVGIRSNRDSMNGSLELSASGGFYRVKSVIIPREAEGGTSTPIDPPLGQPPVPSPNDPHGLMRTQSRRLLEHLIQKEDKRQATGRPVDNKERVQERRLASRLDRLNLDMVVQAGDGNCQFRSLSMELFGSPNYHEQVRKKVVQHILSHKEEFLPFLGEDFDGYLEGMGKLGTWGDELTLRAASDNFGCVIRCITSEADNWYISYNPVHLKVKRELFLAYISPIHYNSLKRRGVLKAFAANSFKRLSFGLSSPTSPSYAAGKSSSRMSRPPMAPEGPSFNPRINEEEEEGEGGRGGAEETEIIMRAERLDHNNNSASPSEQQRGSIGPGVVGGGRPPLPPLLRVDGSSKGPAKNSDEADSIPSIALEDGVLNNRGSSPSQMPRIVV